MNEILPFEFEHALSMHAQCITENARETRKLRQTVY